jgi:AraC family transcriptional regulator
MTLRTHGDEKYRAGKLLSRIAEWDSLRIEHRLVEAGTHNCVRPLCTEFVHILSGYPNIRRSADGVTQQAMARPGTSWLVPAGTNEKLLELDGPAECLIVFLPDTLLERSALEDYDIDPDKIRLAYTGGFTDPALVQISATLHGMLYRPGNAIDDLLADGMRTTLAAHLINNYTVDRWKPSRRLPSLDPKRLRRVLAFIEEHLDRNISLEELSQQACLSPFHFCRLFQDATGRSPHRYLTEQRIRRAQGMLARSGATLAQVAIDTGFSSQANFTRAFRKSTGTTPGQFRDRHRQAGTLAVAIG